MRVRQGLNPRNGRRATDGGENVTASRVAPKTRAAMSRWLVALSIIAAAIGILGLIEPLHFANLGARAMIETAITIAASAGVCLLVAHFARTQHLRDLFLLGALTIVALTEFPATVLPGVLGVSRIAPSAAVQTLAVALVACALVAASMVPTGRLVTRGAHPVVWLSVIGLLAIAVVDVLPLVLHINERAPTTSGAALAAAHPLLAAVQCLCAMSLLVAAVAFLRRPEHRGPESAMLAGVAILLAVAFMHNLALPAVAAIWVTPGAAMTLAAYGLFVSAAVRLNAQTRAEETLALLAAQRERIARDLHDGLAQDLSFIAAHSQRLADDLGAEHPVTIAAKRALAVSRGVIVDLVGSDEPTTAAALRSIADEVESRYGVEVEIRVDSGDAGDWDLKLADREEVVRIAREAIVNAVRHGKAEHIDVYLGSGQSGLLLRVSDDGCGIGDPEAGATSRTGLGMPSMRTGAGLLGGHLVARSAPGGGTQLEVLVS